MKNVNIFVIAHKKIEEKMSDIYIPLQVGNGENLGYLRDNTGKNISEKNPNYCELTGIYWVWKNYNIPDYVGICHYRRFFEKNCINQTKIKEKEILKLFNKYDIILPKKLILKTDVYKFYFMYGEGKEKDLKTTRDVIKELYPKYLESFDSVMKRNFGHYFNMCIMKKEDFCKYCEWLFKILEKVEEKTDLSNYTKQQARIYGYISEILMNVWVEKNKLKIKEYYVAKTDENLYKKVKKELKQKLRKILINRSSK